jgi:intracellular sulfur oxidation DsrE/DsrF family protein
MRSSNPLPRRQILTAMAAAATAGTNLPAAASTAEATSTDEAAAHKIVYQINQPEESYHEAILNSIGAMLKKYVDDVSIAVVAFGPGIHLLAKKPKRPVSKIHQQRVRGMSESYGVRFIACGNTMQSLGWTASDMQDFVTVEDVGAATLMELQEKGYAYIAW